MRVLLATAFIVAVLVSLEWLAKQAVWAWVQIVTFVVGGGG